MVGVNRQFVRLGEAGDGDGEHRVAQVQVRPAKLRPAWILSPGRGDLLLQVWRVDQRPHQVLVVRIPHTQDLVGRQGDAQRGERLVPFGYPPDVRVVPIAVAVHVEGVGQAVLVEIHVDCCVGDRGDEGHVAVVRWGIGTVAGRIADDDVGTEPGLRDQRVAPVEVPAVGVSARSGIDDGHPPEGLRRVELRAAGSRGDVMQPRHVQHADGGPGRDRDVVGTHTAGHGDDDAVGVRVVEVDVRIRVAGGSTATWIIRVEAGHRGPIHGIPHIHRLQGVAVGGVPYAAAARHHLYLDGAVGGDGVAAVHASAPGSVVRAVYEEGLASAQRGHQGAVVIDLRVGQRGHDLKAGEVVVLHAARIGDQILSNRGDVGGAPVAYIWYLPRGSQDRAWGRRVHLPHDRGLFAHDGDLVAAVVEECRSHLTGVDCILEDHECTRIQQTHLGSAAALRGVQRIGVVAVLPVVVVILGPVR